MNANSPQQAPGPILTWQERIYEAHPRSEAEFWPDSLKVRCMELENADLRAALGAAVPGKGEPVAMMRTVGAEFWREVSAADANVLKLNPIFEVRTFYRAAPLSPVPGATADEQISQMKWAAINAHRVCYETMLKYPEIAELGDDGVLHTAIHAIVGVETPNCAGAAPVGEVVAAPPEPKLVLALPDYETRRIVIASDEVIDDERLVCVAIEGGEVVATPPEPKRYLPPPELTWLYTHCRAIGMTCKSDSGKWEEDICLWTINLTNALNAAPSVEGGKVVAATDRIEQWEIYYDNLGTEPYTSGYMRPIQLYGSEQAATEVHAGHRNAAHYTPKKVYVCRAALPPQAPRPLCCSPLLPLRIELQSGINGNTWAAICNKTDRMFIDHLTPYAAVQAVMEYLAAPQAPATSTGEAQ
jgi:hypothetical protein